MRSSSRYYKVKCDQCCALSINGHACHEIGCPKANWPWHYDAELGTCEPIHPSNLDGGNCVDNDYWEQFEDTGRDNWKIDGPSY